MCVMLLFVIIVIVTMTLLHCNGGKMHRYVHINCLLERERLPHADTILSRDSISMNCIEPQ